MTEKANQGEPVVERKKHPRLNFRVNDEERLQIELDAAALGMTPSGYLRFLALRKLRTRAVRRPFADEILLTQLKAEAGRVDGNIAQLLRLANRGEIVYVEELADAAKAIRQFYAEALALLKGSR